MWSCPEHGRYFDPDGMECCRAAWPVDLGDGEDAQTVTDCELPRPRPGVFAGVSMTRAFWVMAGLWLIILGVVGYLYFKALP
jgi:hypothetical protein